MVRRAAQSWVEEAHARVMSMLDKGLPIAPIAINSFASKAANHAVCLELVGLLMAQEGHDGWERVPDQALTQLKTTLQRLQ